jgi:FixJ family two-component response regulator
MPVFLLTGRHEIGDQHRAMGKDVSGLFRKPFSGQDLLAAIDRALRGSDVEEENDR